MTSTLQVFGLLAVAHLGAAMWPGANTALVLHVAARDRRRGLVTALGFWPAGALWSAAGLAGIGGVLAVAPWLETAMRLVCGLYLVWLGWKMLRSAFAEEAGVAPPVSDTSTFLAGFLTNATNPKSIAYYMSVFAATGAFELEPGAQILAVLMLPTIGVAWYATLALLASAGPMRRAFAAGRRWFDGIAGTIMILFGAKLLGGR